MNKGLIVIIIATVVLAVLPRVSSAQISLTADDFLGQLGSRQVIVEDRNSSISINVGSPGANQVWDFRNQVIGDPVLAINEFISIDQTVSASTFPNANLVQKISTDEAPGSAFFNFYNVTPNELIVVGDSAYQTVSGFDTSFVFFQNDTVTSFPIQFNNTWLTAERDTTGIYPLTANISIDTTINTVDGWGTVRLPLGDFECIRLHQKVKVINQSVINGTIFSTSIDSFVQYDWIAKNVFLVANAQSQNGDMNPNFTNAQGFGRLDSLIASPATSITSSSNLPESFSLAQNYPNPFNPETMISYNLNHSGNVEVAVYNIQGQLVKALISKNQTAGAHQVVWDATDAGGNRVSSGLYIYKLTLNNISKTQKMLFLQ